MNDRVLQLDTDLTSALEAGRFEAISAAYAVKLGQELYSEQPMLHRVAPELNAALFVAPSVGCRPDQVITRFASLAPDVMAALHARDQADGGLTPVQADKEVWRRLAA